MALGGDIIEAAAIIDPSLYSAILSETVAQSLTSGGSTPIAFSVESWDPSGGHSGSGTTWAPPLNGFYAIFLSGGPVSNAAGRAELRIRITGVDIAQAASANSAASAPHLAVATVVQLSTTDTVSMIIFQNSGGAINTSVASGNPRMAIFFQGAV